MSLIELSNKFEKEKKKLMLEGQEAIKAEFSKVFENHPELTAIKWTQYTPYFNDGESCTFGIGDVCITNADDLSLVSVYGEYEGDALDVFVTASYNDKARKYSDVWDIVRFANTELGESLFLDIFGDHAIVTVTKDKIEVEEYDHD